MRTLVTGRVLFSVALATLALACGEPGSHRPARGPAPASEPEPQRALNAPSIQEPIEHPVAQAPLPSPGPQHPASEPLPQRPFYGPGTTPPSEQAAKTEKPLTDAEVLGVTDAANRGELQLADLGLKKGTAPEVKQFAHLMKTSHEKALEEDKKLEHKAKLSAAESDEASTLKSEVDKTVKDLQDKHGRDFDRAYLESMIKAHKDVLDIIEKRLTPSAHNPDVKTMLTAMRSTIADHLARAEESRTKLEASPTTSTAPKAKTGSHKAKAPAPKAPPEKKP